MSTIPTLEFNAATFDWISLIFWIIIGLRILMGFFKGGMKTLFKLIVIALAIGLSFALCKAVGTMIGNMGAHNAIQDALTNTIGGKNEILSKNLTNSDLDAMYAAWSGSGGDGSKNDMIVSWLHQGYASSFIPSGIYGNLDSMILAKLPVETDLTTSFNIASLMGASIADMAIIGIGFAATFLLVFIVGMLILAIVSAARKASGKKPGMVSRLLGVAIGVAYAFFFCWSLSIVGKSLMTSVPVINDFCTNSMQLNNDGYWNIGKFFFGINFGYSDLLNWFLSMVGAQAA